MLDKSRKDSLMLDTPSIQGTRNETFPAWPQNLELLLPPMTKFPRPNLPRTGTVSRLQERSFDVGTSTVEFEGSVYSNQRFTLDVNRKDLSRFKKKYETLMDYNLAKRNMINWVQPELILTRTLMSLSRLFAAEQSNAFNQIFICSHNHQHNGRNGTRIHSNYQSYNPRDTDESVDHDSSHNGSHLDVVSSDSTPLRDSMVVSRLNHIGLSQQIDFQPNQFIRTTTDTLSHRLSADVRRSTISSTYETDLQPVNFRRVDKKRGIKMYFCLDMILKRYLKRIVYRIHEYRDQKAVEQFNFQVTVFNKFTQTYKHHFVQNNVAIQTETAPSVKSQAACLRSVAHFIALRNELMVKGAFSSIKLTSNTRNRENLEVEINVLQSKITRQQEWETINTGYKKDAEHMYFFNFLQNLFSRKAEEALIQSFGRIERCQFREKLISIAVKNVITFISRALNKQFTKFVHLALQDKPKLQFEQAERIKGLCSTDDFLERKERVYLLEMFAQLKLMPPKAKSRRSIIGMNRNSVPFTNQMNKTEKHNEGAMILDYITKRTFNNTFRYNHPFLVQRADAFGGAIFNFFVFQKRKLFQGMKKFNEFKQKKIEDANKTVAKLERIFTRTNEVKFAFYYIRMSRTRAGRICTHSEHSKHIKLGCIYMSKILECIFFRTVKNTFFELKLDQLGLSVVLSGIGMKAFGQGSQAQLMAADKLSTNHDRQNQSVGTGAALNTSDLANKDDDPDDIPKKRDRGLSLIMGHSDSIAGSDPPLSRNQSVGKVADGSKPPLPHRSRFSLKPPPLPTNQLGNQQGILLNESPILKTTDDRRFKPPSEDELVTRTPKPTKSTAKVTQMGPPKGSTPMARVSATPLTSAPTFSTLASGQSSKPRGSVTQASGNTPKPKK